jgi:hypothetical protein
VGKNVLNQVKQSPIRLLQVRGRPIEYIMEDQPTDRLSLSTVSNRITDLNLQ